MALEGTIEQRERASKCLNDSIFSKIKITKLRSTERTNTFESTVLILVSALQVRKAKFSRHLQGLKKKKRTAKTDMLRTYVQK